MSLAIDFENRLYIGLKKGKEEAFASVFDCYHRAHSEISLYTSY